VRARLASGNPHKLVELRRSLPGWDIELIDNPAFPPETGSTYAENARGKAVHGRSGAPADAWVIGEDSGIEAAGLEGRPGLDSARWADDGVARLLDELACVSERRGRYVCAIVAIGPQGDEVAVEGTLEGTIATGRRGQGGFGYDPIFVPTGERLTVAELGDAWKATNSHRARAAAALYSLLQDLESASANS
jgi:XTP/dITP diphosphohydrolase